jgi:2-polyprenyl-3-methyl-5-hydroxy-6-metoxy-1,4-benzoquinol methylase
MIADMAGIELENVACALCGQSDSRRIYHLTSEGRLLTAAWPTGMVFDLVKCSHCGLVYVNPRIKEKESARVYDAAKEMAYFNTTATSRNLAYHKLIDKLPDWISVRACNLLDVGCGDGGLMAVAQEHGLEVLGVETSPSMQELVRARLGTTAIWSAALTDLPGGSFDVIALINVIEHVHQPGRMLRTLAELLSPGGVLLIHTMNFDGLPARIKGSRWHQLEPMEHIYYFTAQTLALMAKQAGLRVIDRFHFMSHTGVKSLAQQVSGALHVYWDNGLGLVCRRDDVLKQ